MHLAAYGVVEVPTASHSVACSWPVYRDLTGPVHERLVCQSLVFSVGVRIRLSLSLAWWTLQHKDTLIMLWSTRTFICTLLIDVTGIFPDRIRYYVVYSFLHTGQSGESQLKGWTHNNSIVWFAELLFLWQLCLRRQTVLLIKKCNLHLFIITKEVHLSWKGPYFIHTEIYSRKHSRWKVRFKISLANHLGERLSSHVKKNRFVQ